MPRAKAAVIKRCAQMMAEMYYGLMMDVADHTADCIARGLAPIDAAGRRWSLNEDTFLRRYYARGDAAWCAERLGRSVSAVHARARKRGIRAHGRLA